LRCLWPTIATSPFGGYLVGLLFHLTQDEIVKLVLVVVPILLVQSSLQQFIMTGWICRGALRSDPTDALGARLERLLALPRRLELFAMLPSYLTATTLYGLMGWLWFDKSPGLLLLASNAIGAVLTMLIGLQASLLFQRDVLPLVIEEHRRCPGYRPV